MNLMGLEFANVGVIVALVVVGCLVTFASWRHLLKQASENARRQLDLRLDGLTGSVADLEARVAELTHLNEELTALVRSLRTAAPAAPEVAHPNGSVTKTVAPEPEEEIPTEILVVLAAAVTSFLGKPVRIRSAKMLQSPYEIVNPWAQQGRVFVQASHALRTWGRSDQPRGAIRPGVRH